MELLIEFITLVLLIIIVLIIFCFICVVVRRSASEQNAVHPDGVEMRPLENQQGPNGEPRPDPLQAQGIMRVNEVISRRVEVTVRLAGRTGELEIGEAAV
uniref:Fas apoptotic inhibitory molecule 3 n=1 Tax=Zeugodacus cucurbitae TaxID=28588 RepID=A0A0A1XPV4_ZEUCU